MNLEQLRRQHAADSERGRNAANTTNCDQARRLPEHQALNVTRLGAHRHAKTEFLRACGDDKRDDAIDAEAGEQGSHQLASTAAANGLAAVLDGDGIAPGGEVDVILLT